VIHHNIESLLSLLWQLNRLQKLDKIKIELQIKFKHSRSLEDLGIFFRGVIQQLETSEEGYSKAQGVSLNLCTEILSEHMRKFFKVDGEKFDSFQTVSK